MELSVSAERNLEALAGQLQLLSHWLRYSADKFRASPENERRHAVGVAVKVLSEFVGNVFFLDQDLRQPINALLYALHDLDHGQVGPLLRPSKVGHRAKKPYETGLFRADAAALMDLYRQAGMARKQAAMHAAVKLNELGYRDDKGRRITAKKVERWRDELKSPQDLGDAGVGRYKLSLDLLKGNRPGDLEKAAKSLLDFVPDMIAPSIPRKPTS
jgi:hypothetical protein